MAIFSGIALARAITLFAHFRKTMESDTDTMRAAGGQIKTFGSGIKTDTENATDDIEAAGEGNSGFTAVSAASTAADVWVSHITAIGNNLFDIGDGVVEAADRLSGTDHDNSQQLNEPTIY